jgi:hypothetical protein
VADRNSPQKHVWRARIILLTAEGLGTVEIMPRTGKSQTCVWRWQEWFMAGKIVHTILDNYGAPRLARPSSALRVPLHADLVLLAQRCRGLLSQS